MSKRLAVAAIAPIAAISFASTAAAAPVPTVDEVKAACAGGFTMQCETAIIDHIQGGFLLFRGGRAVKLARALAFTPDMGEALVGLNLYVQSDESGLNRVTANRVLDSSVKGIKANTAAIQAAVGSKRIGSPA